MEKSSANQKTVVRRRWLRTAIAAVPLAAYALTGLKNIPEVSAAHNSSGDSIIALHLGVTNSTANYPDQGNTVTNLYAGRQFGVFGNKSGTSFTDGAILGSNSANDSAALVGSAYGSASGGIGVVAVGSLASNTSTALSTVGRVGVSTSAPKAQLHILNVEAGTQGNALVMDTPSTAQQALLGFWSAGTQKWQFGKGTDDSFTIWDQAGSKALMVGFSAGNGCLMPTAGNLGVGTFSPTQKLHVVGNVLATGSYLTSDLRFKDDIEPLTNVLDRLEQVRGVTFEWNQKFASLHGVTPGRQIGLIAQEVEQTFPELVAKGDMKSVKDARSLDYSKFTAVLVEAVKELHRQNSALQERLEKLEQSIGTKPPN